MKKYNTFNLNKIIFCFILCLTLFGCGFTLPKSFALAEDEIISDSQVIECGTGLYKIEDERLYNALLSLDGSLTVLTAGSFKNLTSLDLSGKEITSLSGLIYMKFDSLTSLNLSNNSINSTFTGFSNMPVLETIDLSNNKITSFDGSFSTKLSSVNASHNIISHVNLSTLTEGATADFSYNKLSSFDALILPEVSANISLTHNMLTSTAPQTICTLNLGLQGVYDNASLTKNSIILFYGLENVEKVELYKLSSDKEQTLVTTLLSNEQATNLSIGDYKLILVETEELDNYEDMSFIVRPVKPIVTLTDKEGKIASEPYLINYKATLTLDAEGEVYYQINSGKKINGKVINIESNGSYTITCYQVIDGYESEVETILVICRYTEPLSVVWLFVGIVLMAILLYAGIVWKNNVNTVKIEGKKVHKDFD